MNNNKVREEIKNWLFKKFYIIRGNIYPDISHYINKVNIPVRLLKLSLYSSSLYKNIPNDVIPHWIKVDSGKTLINTYLTTAKLIDICNDRIEFYIDDKFEALRTYTYVNDYLYNISHQINLKDLSLEYKEIIDNIHNYKDAVFSILNKFSKKDKAFKEYIDIVNGIDNIFSKYLK